MLQSTSLRGNLGVQNRIRIVDAKAYFVFPALFRIAWIHYFDVGMTLV